MKTWKLVPVEYTIEQMLAAHKAAKENKPRANDRDVKAHAFDLCTGYRVMVAAAPPAPSDFPPGCLPPLPLLPHGGESFTRAEMMAYAVAFGRSVERFALPGPPLASAAEANKLSPQRCGRLRDHRDERSGP